MTSFSAVYMGDIPKVSEIRSGVPQDTVLGPLLFIIFINDLEHSVSHFNISFFADDTRICKKYLVQMMLNFFKKTWIV